MKRILMGTLTALAALSAAVPAQAGRTFGLFYHCGSCCDFKVRQFNAFTPVCSGNLTCDGCLPFSQAMPALGYGGYGAMAPSCCPMDCNTCYAPQMMAPGMMQQNPEYAQQMGMPQQMAMPQQMMPQQMPQGGPMLLPAGQGAAQPYNPGYNIQPVAYYPNYGYAPPMPNYPMMNYWNPMGQVPYYWYPMGGR